MDRLEELKIQSEGIRKRILKFEEDLKTPLKRDLDANAVEEGSREVLYGLYEIEKANLIKVEEDIQNLM